MKTLLCTAVVVVVVHVAMTGPWVSAAGRAMGAQGAVYATPSAAPVGR